MSVDPRWPWRQRPPSAEEQLDAALDDSFPASDPPAVLRRSAQHDKPPQSVRAVWRWTTMAEFSA